MTSKLFKRKIKNFNYKFFLVPFFIVTQIFSQSGDVGLHFIDNNKPFWITSNERGLYSSGSIISFELEEEFKIFNYGAEIIIPQNKGKATFLSQAYFYLNKNKYYIYLGKKNYLQKFNFLSSGSLVESLNAMPIPKISIETKNYNYFSFSKINFKYLLKIAHGWIGSDDYIKNPFLHQKSLNIKKEISENSFIDIGLNHMAIWGGKTIQHGRQPSGLEDYFRIILGMPGDDNSIEQEQRNSLGNHLGAWSISYQKSDKHKIVKFYMEHPFEDESGARWILNEFDGLYGINIEQEKYSFISKFTYEYIYTMNQSGTEGASDSTYGWDNYYNHYIYQSGWTNNGRVIGNPLFTLGSNDGRYSNNQYIINNRIKAHHFGFIGSISYKINYKILFTYSENFGIYPDEDYFKFKNKAYRFDGGLIQRSGLIELSINNVLEKVNISLAYGFDDGELLNKTDSFMLKINHKFKF